MSNETACINGLHKRSSSGLIKISTSSNLEMTVRYTQSESLGKIVVKIPICWKGIDAFHLREQFYFLRDGRRIAQQKEVIQDRLVGRLANEPGKEG